MIGKIIGAFDLAINSQTQVSTNKKLIINQWALSEPVIVYRGCAATTDTTCHLIFFV